MDSDTDTTKDTTTDTTVDEGDIIPVGNTIYGPTQYTPVAVKTSEGTTAVDDQTQGSLAVLVQLPTNSQIQFDSDGTKRYVELLKGPYSVIKVISLGVDYEGFKGYNAGAERPTQPAGKVVYRFNPPDLGKDDEGNQIPWLVEGIEVEEIEAGDHAKMKITYADRIETSSGSGSAGSSTQAAIDKTTWQLKYVPFSRNILAYCKEDAHKPDFIKRIYNDKNGDAGAEEQSGVDTAYAKNILDYLAHRNDTFEDYDNLPDIAQMQWGQNGSIWGLNANEQKVATKYLKSNYATFHHPVIYKTHYKIFHWQSTALSDLSVASTSSFFTDVGEDIDTIGSPLSCPYSKVVDKYQWLRVADDVQVDYEDNGMKATHSECWEGYLSVDPDLYGPNAWKPNSI